MLKTPFLVEHFIEHHQENPSIGISKFFSMHYLGHDQNDNDINKDMKLPFKKIDIHAHLVLFQSLSKKFILYKQPYFQNPETNYKDKFIQDPLNGKLYKPPQYS